ncbi:MAG: hypothetical protein IPP63_02335 [Chloracidobacterium sp.]|nr:hypothetical protein [Chloracidobacterium sp.]
MAIDLKFYPEADDLYRAIPQIKEQLQLNIELAAPSDFIPELPDWQNRCEFITREGSVSFTITIHTAKHYQRSNADTIKTLPMLPRCFETVF